VDPRAGLDAVAKRKVPAPAENRTPVIQLVVTILTELLRLAGIEMFLEVKGKGIPVL